jgi:hypothetical protein
MTSRREMRWRVLATGTCPRWSGRRQYTTICLDGDARFRRIQKPALQCKKLLLGSWFKTRKQPNSLYKFVAATNADHLMQNYIEKTPDVYVKYWFYLTTVRIQKNKMLHVPRSQFSLHQPSVRFRCASAPSSRSECDGRHSVLTSSPVLKM